MAKNEIKARIATHEQRAEKLRSKAAHLDAMASSELYRRLHRARTSLDATIDALSDDLVKYGGEDLEALSVAAEALDNIMARIRATDSTGDQK